MAVLCVFYSLGDGELALCRQPVLILWPPPKLQHVGNKPFSSNPQTVQQSIGNYLSQSMGRPFYFSLSSCPICILSPRSPPSRSFSSCLLSHFLLSLCFLHLLLHSPLPHFYLHSLQPSPRRSTYSELRQLSSSRAINRRRLHPWNI